MRFAKVIFFAFAFVLAMVFFIQNEDILSQPMSLTLDLFVTTFKSIPLPFYFYLLVGFFIGAVFSTLYFFMEKIRLGKALRACRTKNASLQQELNSLRNMPLDEPGLSGAMGEDGD